MSNQEGLSMWTVYHSPIDFQNLYVARLFVVAQAGVYSTNEVVVGHTLEQVREQLPPGLTCLPRQERDAPQIVEVWL